MNNIESMNKDYTEDVRQEDTLAMALSKAQGRMAGAKKDKENPFFKSSYADLSSVFDAIRRPFFDNGLSITQPMDILDGKQVLHTRLMHTSGGFINSTMILPNEPNPQKLGSLITYYRRYALMAIAGIAAEDDDGNSASYEDKKLKTTAISSTQVGTLEKLINGHTEVRKKVLENCNGQLESITVDRFPGAASWIKAMVAKEEQAND